MGDFVEISKDMIPVFQELETLRERYGITSMVIESLHSIDQFTVNASKKSFTGRRQRDRSGNHEIPFIQIK